MKFLNPPQLIKTSGDGSGLGKFGQVIWEGDPEEWFDRNQKSQEARESEEAALKEAIKNRVPRAITAGPLEFSSSVGLERWPTFVADVNGYYKELQIHWSASNATIRQAYQDLQGETSDRLTYVIKQLLDPEIRRGYDATPFGSVFFDKYIAEYVKSEMLKDSIKENGKVPTFDDQIESGAEVIDFSKFLNKSLHPDIKEWSDDVTLENRWKWGYYLLNIDIYDTELLRKWQQALIKELATREAILSLSVGIKSGLSGVYMVNSKVVAFIGIDDNPSIQLAREVVDQIILATNQTVNK